MEMELTAGSEVRYVGPEIGDLPHGAAVEVVEVGDRRDGHAPPGHPPRRVVVRTPSGALVSVRSRHLDVISPPA